MKTQWVNVVLLFLSQALFQTASILVITLSGVVGLEMAPDKNLATLPLAMITVGTAVMLFPASAIIKKLGQRKGFMIGTTIGMLAGVLSYYGIVSHSFFLFVSGNMLVGSYQGFAQYYRFAAADTVTDTAKSRAISFVIAGGVVAAFVGPNLAKYTQSIGTIPFAYSYLTITLLSIVALAVLFFLKMQRGAIVAKKSVKQGRPLKQIILQKDTITALIASAVGYAAMVITMTATPIAMHQAGYATADSATVIQWHVLGMFLPSFFTGILIQRFGLYTILFTGLVALSLHVILALWSGGFIYFVSGLFLVGIGWNFMFIGGTTLLTRVYQPEEKEKTQAFHDFLVFSIISISSFAAGALLNYWGWKGVTLSLIPLVALAFIRVATNRRKKTALKPSF